MKKEKQEDTQNQEETEVQKYSEIETEQITTFCYKVKDRKGHKQAYSGTFKTIEEATHWRERYGNRLSRRFNRELFLESSTRQTRVKNKNN